MCPPVMFAISLAIAAASAVAQDQGQRAEARSQKQYQEAQMRAHNEAALQNAESAIKEQNEQTAAERQQQMQQEAAASREKQKHQIDFLQKRGTAMASSPYGAGNSFDALMADYSRALGMANDVTDEQLKMQGVAADTNIRGYRDRAQARINAQQGYFPSPIKQPSTMATALGFLGDAAGSYNSATNHGKESLF